MRSGVDELEWWIDLPKLTSLTAAEGEERSSFRYPRSITLEGTSHHSFLTDRHALSHRCDSWQRMCIHKQENRPYEEFLFFLSLIPRHHSCSPTLSLLPSFFHTLSILTFSFSLQGLIDDSHFQTQYSPPYFFKQTQSQFKTTTKKSPFFRLERRGGFHWVPDMSCFFWQREVHLAISQQATVGKEWKEIPLLPSRTSWAFIESLTCHASSDNEKYISRFLSKQLWGKNGKKSPFFRPTLEIMEKAKHHSRRARSGSGWLQRFCSLRSSPHWSPTRGWSSPSPCSHGHSKIPWWFRQSSRWRAFGLLVLDVQLR